MRAAVLAYCSLGNPKLLWIPIQSACKTGDPIWFDQRGGYSWFMFAKLVHKCLKQFSVVCWEIFWTSYWDSKLLTKLQQGGTHPPFMLLYHVENFNMIERKRFNMLSMVDTAASSARYSLLMHVEFIPRQVHTQGLEKLQKGYERGLCETVVYYGIPPY